MKRTTVLLIEGRKEWECPAGCGTRDMTSVLVPNRYHPCPKLGGLLAPLVPAGTDCTIRPLPREDYLHGEIQRTDAAGRPYGGVSVERADGSNDLHMFAPLAQANAEELGLK